MKGLAGLRVVHTVGGRGVLGRLNSCRECAKIVRSNPYMIDLVGTGDGLRRQQKCTLVPAPQQDSNYASENKRCH